MLASGGWRALRAPLALVALVAAAYGQTVGFDLVWDDHALLVDNPVLGERVRWREVFTSSAYLDRILGAGHMYRPLLIANLAADRALWGLHPAGFHLSNVLAHLAVVLVTYRLGLRFTGSRAIGFLAGALLAVHPSAVEAVAWVAARMDLLVALATGAAVLLLRGCHRAGGWLRVASSLLCFALALGAKENAVAIPVVVTWAAWAHPGWFAASGSPPRPRELVGRVAPFWLLLGLYGALRRWILGGVSPVPVGLGDLPAQIPRALVALATYAEMTVLPRPVVGYVRIEPPAHVIDARVVLGLAVVGLLGVGLLWLRRAQPPASLALGWYAAALIPTSNLLPVYLPHEIYVSERSLYPALVGWCLFVAVAVNALRGSARQRLAGSPRFLWMVAGGVIATLLLVTAVKVTSWRDDVTLWSTATVADPGSAFARYNLATALARAGRLEDAYATLRETQERFPTDARVAYVGGWIAELRDDPAEAQRQYERAIRLGLRLDTAYRQAATLAARLGEWDRAGRWFGTAALVFPKEAWPQVGLGWYRKRQGGADEAQVHFERAVRLDPNSPERPWFLGRLYEADGRAGDAAQAYQAALALEPSYLAARAALASLAEREGRREEAVAHWRHIAADLPAGSHRAAALVHVRRLEAASGGGSPLPSR